MSIHISCDMYLCLGLHLQIKLYYVLPYKAKISAQHGIGFILDRCFVYLGLTVPNLQKKRLLMFEIFNIKKCTLFFGTEYMLSKSLKRKLYLLHLWLMQICPYSNFFKPYFDRLIVWYFMPPSNLFQSHQGNISILMSFRGFTSTRLGLRSILPRDTLMKDQFDQVKLEPWVYRSGVLHIITKTGRAQACYQILR